MQEDKGLHDAGRVSLFHVISGASPDYSIVAQKEAALELTGLFDSLYQASYGITLEELCVSYESRLLGIINGQARQISSLEQQLASQREQFSVRSQRLADEFDELRGLIMNTRHRTLFGAVEWLLKKIKRRTRLRLE